MRDEYDFSKGKRAKDVPHLAALQANQPPAKQRITIYLDTDVIEGFRERAAAAGSAYQSEINRALRAAMDAPAVTLEAIREVIQQEIREHRTEQPAESRQKAG